MGWHDDFRHLAEPDELTPPTLDDSEPPPCDCEECDYCRAAALDAERARLRAITEAVASFAPAIGMHPDPAAGLAAFTSGFVAGYGGAPPPRFQRHESPDGGHSYTLDGEPIPSVSRILQGKYPVPDTEAVRNGAARGTALHTMITRALLALPVNPPEDDCADVTARDAYARFISWRSWWLHNPVVPAFVEHPVWYESADWETYAGTVDFIGAAPTLGPGWWVIDWKPKWTTRGRLQVCAYAEAAEQRGLAPAGSLRCGLLALNDSEARFQEVDRAIYAPKWFNALRAYYNIDEVK